jgi:hypothetical protein
VNARSQAVRFFRKFLEREELLQERVLEHKLALEKAQALKPGAASQVDEGGQAEVVERSAPVKHTHALDAWCDIRQFKAMAREGNGEGRYARFRFFLMGHACVVQLLTLPPLSRCLYRKFVEAQSEHALGDKFFEPGDRERIHAASALHDYKKDTFDFMQNTALSAMRKGQFPRFCEHQFFDRLMAVKQGQPSAIMLEREMGTEEPVVKKKTKLQKAGSLVQLGIKLRAAKAQTEALPLAAAEAPGTAAADTPEARTGTPVVVEEA